MASEKKQQYGLIIPAKRKVIGPTQLPKPSVFADESSSDEDGVRSSVKDIKLTISFHSQLAKL